MACRPKQVSRAQRPCRAPKTTDHGVLSVSAFSHPPLSLRSYLLGLQSSLLRAFHDYAWTLHLRDRASRAEDGRRCSRSSSPTDHSRRAPHDGGKERCALTLVAQPRRARAARLSDRETSRAAPSTSAGAWLPRLWGPPHQHRHLRCCTRSRPRRFVEICSGAGRAAGPSLNAPLRRGQRRAQLHVVRPARRLSTPSGSPSAQHSPYCRPPAAARRFFFYFRPRKKKEFFEIEKQVCSIRTAPRSSSARGPDCAIDVSAVSRSHPNAPTTMITAALTRTTTPHPPNHRDLECFTTGFVIGSSGGEIEL